MAIITVVIIIIIIIIIIVILEFRCSGFQAVIVSGA